MWVYLIAIRTMKNSMTKAKKRERRVSVSFPDHVWDYLDDEAKETGIPVSLQVTQLISNHVREKKPKK